LCWTCSAQKQTEHSFVECVTVDALAALCDLALYKCTTNYYYCYHHYYYYYYYYYTVKWCNVEKQVQFIGVFCYG